ncbi:MAG: tRNA preQ1(34) S-adenosylmethionine ribosyltransferase-isomerase QueA [Xanthobacteraceae bacterium]|nr:tRNA preQ1(34) S-adenosylmethionine ribosyltransferase-isomerase QueA [Xanthobacteraceae bacterium]
MRTDLFDYDLPPERIALRPAVPRDAARLLVVRPDATPEFEDRGVRDLPDLLRSGDALVVNDSKVIPARLIGERVREEARAQIEATLIVRVGADRWRALVKPAKRLRAGDRIRFGHEARVCLLGALDATVEEKGEGGEVLLRFDFHGPALEQAIETLGHMPLPPYIAARRADDERDRIDYQTVFAKHEGSVAAPTAGLHFSEELLAQLAARGVAVHNITLAVGPGTFLPVQAEDTGAHRMHPERGEISPAAAAALNATRARGGRIVAVGSTALRLIESVADEMGRLAPFSGETALFITPGYRFRAADLLLTNFHLPRSTLFMLVAAFTGLERMQRAYAHAIKTGYRFYSYGDACLLFPDAATHNTH